MGKKAERSNLNGESLQELPFSSTEVEHFSKKQSKVNK